MGCIRTCDKCAAQETQTPGQPSNIRAHVFGLARRGPADEKHAPIIVDLCPLCAEFIRGMLPQPRQKG